MLFLLPLAAVPVILHLFSLRRLKTVEITTFRFLFDSFVQQRRRMRLLDALVAMLRALFLLLLVFLISRPVASHWSACLAAARGATCCCWSIAPQA